MQITVFFISADVGRVERIRIKKSVVCEAAQQEKAAAATCCSPVLGYFAVPPAVPMPDRVEISKPMHTARQISAALILLSKLPYSRARDGGKLGID